MQGESVGFGYVGISCTEGKWENRLLVTMSNHNKRGDSLSIKVTKDPAIKLGGGAHGMRRISNTLRRGTEEHPLVQPVGHSMG